MLLDIVILPPKKLRDDVGKKISNIAKGRPYTYLVDNKKLIPHLSLFHININKRNLPELSEKIRVVLEHHKPFNIRSVKFGHPSVKNGQVFFLLAKSRALKKLHTDIVNSCHSLRAGEVPLTGITKLTSLAKFYQKKIPENFKFR
ncbi:MAG: 2'-5' RNA ligase family protein [Candidatus Marinimicrobia bacterium]|nr:2'-5' RNA ligase family protein [Candidatus Neomarinimicrobiota bacterium]